jgi:hypothetical protein
MLMNGMVSYYKNRHKCQIVGLNRKDLAMEHREEILECLADIPSDSIQRLNYTQFHIASKSHPGLYHTVDLYQSTCKCEDFLRIWFCRHIAAIIFHFPELALQEIDSRLFPK